MAQAQSLYQDVSGITEPTGLSLVNVARRDVS